MSREIVENVLGPEMTREIWTGNFARALPITIQDFDLTAVLPAIFYMYRFGQRRGKGKFINAFAQGEGTERERRRSVTIERVAKDLAEVTSFEGFRGEVESAILGDLLLCFCLENVKRALGRNEQIQRVAPAHYMASWVDLPEHVAHLRFVPEMIVAMLADQKGDVVKQTQDGERTWFPVGKGLGQNVLIRAFDAGMSIQGELASRKSDKFEEMAEVGIDQLLMIRLAQHLGEAPDKLRGGGGERISNQRPVAELAARYFSEDIRRFVRSYANVIPRQTFVGMLESCMAVGLVTILTSVVEIMLEWEATGRIRPKGEQKPAGLFVDASNGMDGRLRVLAENSFDDYLRRVERFPVVLMGARLVDWGARYNRHLKEHAKSTGSYATEWLNLLGDVLHDRHDESRHILYDIEQKATVLGEKLDKDLPEIAALLDDSQGYPNPVWRLSEALTMLQGRDNTQKHLLQCMDASLMIDRPNGVAVKRRVRQAGSASGQKTREIRCLLLTDSVIDYLVHVHLLPSGNRNGLKRVSLKEFLHIIRERYGFYLDEAPPGMVISNDLLQANRAVLERRLRDLGLLSGVNDAEAMKRLVPRFMFSEGVNHDAE